MSLVRHAHLEWYHPFRATTVIDIGHLGCPRVQVWSPLVWLCLELLLLLLGWLAWTEMQARWEALPCQNRIPLRW